MHFLAILRMMGNGYRIAINIVFAQNVDDKNISQTINHARYRNRKLTNYFNGANFRKTYSRGI